MDDESYSSIFQEIFDQIYLHYKPQVILLQCGADSISGDRLGCFNLSVAGHGACVQFSKKYNIPMLVVGGGGYTLRNVARAWAYETSILVDKYIPSEMPQHDFMDYYCPEYKVHMPTSNMENQNTKKDLDRIKGILIDNIKKVCAVGANSDTSLPNIDLDSKKQELEDTNVDKRNKDAMSDMGTIKPYDSKEFYDQKDLLK